MLRISAAPAQVSRKCFFDFILGRVGVMVEQRLGGDDKARGAIAALQGMMFDVSINQWMVISGDPFDSLDGLAIALDGERHTGKDRPAIEDDGAGPTCSSVAKHLGSRQAQPVVEEMIERPFRLYMELIILPIDGDPDNALGQWERFGRMLSNDMSFQ